MTYSFVHAIQRDLHQNNLSLGVPALICSYCKQNSEFWTRISSLYGSHTSPAVLCMQNSGICTRVTSVCGFQPSSVVLCIQKSAFRNRKPCFYGSQPLSVVLCIQKSDNWARIACLSWSQTSPVILWMQNGVPSIRITSRYGFKPSSVAFGWKTSTFGPE